MGDYLQALFIGLENTASLQGIAIVMCGTLIAMVTSFLPGIGTASLMTLLMLATMSWTPESVLLLFGALVGGATFMGSITAILFNIPGSAPNAATLIDGYPLSQAGYPKMAIAAAATASAIGSVLGVVVLLCLLPFLNLIVPNLGPWEQLLLGIWGLSTIVALPNTSKAKAAAMCFLGLLLSMVGLDPIDAQPRWTFGTDALLLGFGIIPVLLGLFTFAEIMSWSNEQLAPSQRQSFAKDDSTQKGIAAVFQHRWLTAKSSIIGTLVGIIPGVGGTVAGFVAYSQAQLSAEDPEGFGKGDVRGVIAPEAATDAKDGGSLVPAIALGLPGSEVGVFLITVLLLHGLVPGAPMLSTQLPLTLTLILALLVSNLLTSLLGVALAPKLAQLNHVALEKVALPVLVISLVLILQLNGRLMDLFTAIGFGVFGFFLKRYDWPRVPLVIAFVLGEFVEKNLELSLRLIELDRISPLQRPWGLCIIGLILLSLVVLGRKSGSSGVKPLVALRELPLASLIFGASLLFLLAGFIEGYSSYGLFISLAANLCALRALLLSYGPGPAKAGSALTPGKFFATPFLAPFLAHRELSLLSFLAIASGLLGFTLSIGLFVFFWLIRNAPLSSDKAVTALAWGLATTTACYYLLISFLRVELPEPLLSQLLSGLF